MHPHIQELRTIISLAPPILSLTESATSSYSPSNRKEVSGDCPICFTEFEPHTEEIVWCKAACGNNIHKTCFEQWAKTKNGNSAVRCVYWYAAISIISPIEGKVSETNTEMKSRTPWQGDEDSIAKIKSKGRVNQEGYVNVANQLGLPEDRGKNPSFSIITQI